MNTQRKAGIAPTRNMYFHAMPGWIALMLSRWPSVMLTMPAITLPTAESAWSRPRAPVRERSGSVSATSATARPKTPPTPRPVRNRNNAKSIQPFEKAERPVQTE